MEKYFNKETSNSDDSAGSSPEDEELSYIEMEMLLRAKRESLELQYEVLLQKLKASDENLARIENPPLDEESFQSESSPSVSPIGSPIQQYPDLLEERFENLPDSTVLAGSLRQPDIVPYVNIGALERQSENISKRIENLEEEIETELKNLSSNSPPKTSDNETQAVESSTKMDTRINTQADLGIIETDEESNEEYDGKGKVAANKNYRYKKRSKTNVSFGESSATDSAVILTEAAVTTPEPKAVGSKLPKAGRARISPAAKRKGSELSKEDQDKQQFDESSINLKSPKSHADDNDDIKIAKKLKFEDVEKVRREYPTLTELLSQKTHESIDLASFMDPPHTDQSLYEREELNLPSTSGLSNVVGYMSTSEESPITSGSDDVMLSEGGDLPLTSARNVMLIDREESSLTSVSDLSPDVRGEDSCLTSTSEDTSLSGSGDSKHFQE